MILEWVSPPRPRNSTPDSFSRLYTKPYERPPDLSDLADALSRVYRLASWEASLKSMLSPLIFDLGTWSVGVDSLSVGARARGVLQLLQLRRLGPLVQLVQ